MSDQNNKNDIEQTIERASEKLHIDINVLREIRAEDIQYLLDHCPFLQIVGPEIALDTQTVKLISSQSGWDIHDYGDALSSSPGRFIFGGGDFRINEDEGDEDGGGIVNPGKGTVVNQAWVTASDMLLMAYERGWSFVTLVDGHAVMKRAAWVRAVELGITIQGFEPSQKDRRIRDRVIESSEQFKQRQDLVFRLKN